MTIAPQIAVPITDATGAGEARRVLNRLSSEIGLNDTAGGRAAIIVTELGTNLAKHARGGEILLRSLGDSSSARRGVEILAVDRGPGMADLGRCLEDGFSTSGTPGGGLGAVRRQANDFDVFTQESRGTVVYASVSESDQPASAAAMFQWSVVCRPAPRETANGDSWSVVERPGELSVMLADGLGHGPEAAKASSAAVEGFAIDAFAPPTLIFERAGARMRGTRGGAVAVAQLTASRSTLTYAGIGNISGQLRSLYAGDAEKSTRGLISHNGIVGVQVHRARPLDYPCSPEGLLIMYSDGLQSRWRLDDYPGLAMRRPAVIAGVLYRDFTRGPDDVTVAVVRFSLDERLRGG